MTRCPTREHLERLLADQLGQAEEKVLNVHLAECAACRDRLEELTRPNDPALTAAGRADDTSPRLEDACAQFLAAFLESECPLGKRPNGQATNSALPGATLAGVAVTLAGAGTAPPWPVIPGFVILGELGQGGLGVVYRAQHLGLKRPVALKMIRAGARARPIDVARFRREAEAVGRLHHPNIIQVYDIGECNGQPYICMELVEGCTLQEAIKDTPQPPLVAARLSETLARAVQAMHEQGIIHRDLKPSNILLPALSDQPTAISQETGASLPRRPIADLGQPTAVKISDFGMAKDLHDAADLTVTRDVLGTPNYMAPEQAQSSRSKIGPATDLYALGTLLYELLTGQPPFRGPTSLETMVQITFQEPVPPRQLQPKVPRDLETICLKCLQKEPARRYGSAQALADDLQRFLEGRPIQARPVGRAGKTVRWCRRNPWLAGLSAAVLLLLLTLAVGGPVAAYRQAHLRRQAQEEKERADRNFALAKRAVEETVARLTQDERLGQGDFHHLRLDLCQSLLPFYEEFARQQNDDPLVQAERGRAFLWLAQVRREMGQLEQAEADLHQGRNIFEHLVAAYPTVPDHRLKLAVSHKDLGLLLVDLGRSPEAEAHHGAALELHRCLVADFPTVREYRQELANSHAVLGGWLLEQTRWSEAETHMRAALDLWEKLATDFPAVPQYRQGHAKSFLDLGSLFAARGQKAEAQEAFRRSLDVLEKLVADCPHTPVYRRDLALNHHNLGWLTTVARQFTDAEKHYRRALQLREALATEFPAVPHCRRELAVSHDNLGVLLVELGREEEGQSHVQQSLAIRQKLVAEFPSVAAFAEELGDSYCDCGKLLCDKGQPEEALKWYARALVTLTPVLKKDPGRASGRHFLASTHAYRAAALDQLGRHEEAAADWEKAVALASGEVDRIEFRLGQAASQARAGQHNRALATAEELVRGKEVLAANLHRAARVYALAASGMRDDAALRERHAAHAVHLLKRAADSGYFKDQTLREQLQKDADFAGLRERDDYKQLFQ